MYVAHRQTLTDRVLLLTVLTTNPLCSLAHSVSMTTLLSLSLWTSGRSDPPSEAADRTRLCAHAQGATVLARRDRRVRQRSAVRRGRVVTKHAAAKALARVVVWCVACQRSVVVITVSNTSAELAAVDTEDGPQYDYELVRPNDRALGARERRCERQQQWTRRRS